MWELIGKEITIDLTRELVIIVVILYLMEFNQGVINISNFIFSMSYSNLMSLLLLLCICNTFIKMLCNKFANSKVYKIIKLLKISLSLVCTYFIILFVKTSFNISLDVAYTWITIINSVYLIKYVILEFIYHYHDNDRIFYALSRHCMISIISILILSIFVKLMFLSNNIYLIIIELVIYGKKYGNILYYVDNYKYNKYLKKNDN